MPTCAMNRKGGFSPREPEGQTTLRGLWDTGRPTDSQLEAVGRQLRRVTLLEAEQPFSLLVRLNDWLADISGQ